MPTKVPTRLEVVSYTQFVVAEVKSARDCTATAPQNTMKLQQNTAAGWALNLSTFAILRVGKNMII